MKKRIWQIAVVCLLFLSLCLISSNHVANASNVKVSHSSSTSIVVKPSIYIANCSADPSGFTRVSGYDFDGNFEQVCFAQGGYMDVGGVYQVTQVYSGNNIGYLNCDGTPPLHHTFPKKFVTYGVSNCPSLWGVYIGPL